MGSSSRKNIYTVLEDIKHQNEGTQLVMSNLDVKFDQLIAKVGNSEMETWKQKA